VLSAVYARKSNEQVGVADEAKSVARQVEHARTYAARKGWTVSDEFVFVDDGISGAEFANRPGFVRLMASLKPKPRFEVLIMSEESRLGREQIEVSYALKQLIVAGVRVFLYLDDRERTLDSPIEKAMLALQTMSDEMEREKARSRLSDAMIRKARQGYVTGGRCFGYDNVEVVGPDGRRSHVERVPNAAEAPVVGRIFELCASGKGVKAIAKLLNAEGVLSPRPATGRPRTWSPASVRSLLYRRAYLGEVIYGMTRRRNRWGQAEYQRRPSSEWQTTIAPKRRIVSDKLWAAAHRRLDSAARTYLRGTGGQLWGRPATGIESRYLLSGLTRCGVCGGSMIAHCSSRGGDARRWRYYTCSSYSNRGPSVCPNRLPLPMDGADLAVLDQLATHVLDAEVVEGAIQDALAELRAPAATAEATRATLESDLKRVEQEQQRYAEAIASAGDVAVLVQALQVRERRRVDLRDALAALDGQRRASSFDVKRIERDLRRRLDDWRGLLRRQTPVARQILTKLIDGRLTFTPDPEQGLYRFEGAATLGTLLRGVTSSTKADEAMPWVWRARRDLNPRPTGSKPGALSN
jgi:site-specific DNA recombinase